jgi:hypothetical protein
MRLTNAYPQSENVQLFLEQLTVRGGLLNQDDVDDIMQPDDPRQRVSPPSAELSSGLAPDIPSHILGFLDLEVGRRDPGAGPGPRRVLRL